MSFSYDCSSLTHLKFLQMCISRFYKTHLKLVKLVTGCKNKQLSIDFFHTRLSFSMLNSTREHLLLSAVVIYSHSSNSWILRPSRGLCYCDLCVRSCMCAFWIACWILCGQILADGFCSNPTCSASAAHILSTISSQTNKDAGHACVLYCWCGQREIWTSFDSKVVLSWVSFFYISQLPDRIHIAYKC